MENKEKRFVSAVVYLHDAENRIIDFVSSLVRELSSKFEAYEIICVNDDSKDLSVERLKAYAEENADRATITLLNLSYFHGLESAMNAGVDLAIGDYVFEFDTTEMDYPENLILQVYDRALQGYDIVSATPKTEKNDSKLFYRVFDRYSGTHYKMKTESFRVLSRRLINRVQMMHNAIPYRKVVYATNGLLTDSISYESNKSRQKRTAQEKKYRRRLALDTLLVYTDIGYRFSFAMTLVMMLISLMMVVYTVVVYCSSNPVEGWTTTVLFLSVAFFGLFGILAIIIKYLQLQINLMYRRKRYVYSSIEKLTK